MSKIESNEDFSLGMEKTPVTITSKQKKRLKNFDNNKQYITESYIKNGSLDDYKLTPEYSCKCIKKDTVKGNCLISVCCDDDCECLENHVEKYECNRNCTCNEKIVCCENREVQNGIKKRLYLEYISRSKGFGVFCKESIKKGEFICEYIGNILNKNSALEKINSNYMKNKPNYVLQVKENYVNISVSTYIDAEEKGNISRFLNHSCEPNLSFDLVRIEHFIPHVAFYANRDIKEGEELTFSYLDSGTTELSDFNESNKPCECGSSKCRKFLPS